MHNWKILLNYNYLFLHICAATLVSLAAHIGWAEEIEVSPWHPPKPNQMEMSWVQLENGEWMGGEILSLLDGKLEFESENFGTVKVEWRKVRKIFSKDKVSVYLADDTMADGYLRVEEGKIQLLSDNNEIISLSEKPLYLEASGSSHWKLKSSVGINFIKGNTEQIDYKLLVNVERRDKETRLFAEYLTFVSSVEDILTESNRQFTLDYDVFMDDKYFWRVLDVKYFSDKFQNIDSRLTIGSGLGHKLIDTSQSELAMGVGLSYQRTDFESVEPGSAGSETSPAVTFFTEFETELTQDIDFHLGYDFSLIDSSSGKYQHDLSSVVSIELNDFFDFDISFFWNRTEQPTVEMDGTAAAKDDLRLVFGIGVKN